MSDTRTSPTVLLSRIAADLNQLRDMDVNLSLQYRAVLTDHGYVMQGPDGVWAAKLKINDSAHS